MQHFYFTSYLYFLVKRNQMMMHFQVINRLTFVYKFKIKIVIPEAENPAKKDYFFFVTAIPGKTIPFPAENSFENVNVIFALAQNSVLFI